MSKTDSLHYQLCLEGAKWLNKKKKSPPIERALFARIGNINTKYL